MIRCPDCGQPIKNPIRNMAMKELQKYNPKLKQVCEHCAHLAERKSLIVMRRDESAEDFLVNNEYTFDENGNRKD